MRTFLHPLILLILIAVSTTIHAQTAGVAIDKDAKTWVNLNVGGFWQGSDVKPSFGTGAGLTFDYYFIRNNTSIFGIGVRGQYLKATSYGNDITRDYNIQNNTALNGTSGNPDYASLPAGQNYVYQNYKTDISDISGNVIITLNRLRAVSRLNLYVFGGLGSTGYLARMDQLDATRNLYDYDLISSSSSKSLIKKELKDLRDGLYESFGENGSSRAWALNATVGAGFGVQLSSRVQIGIEHKVGFTGTDLLDANQWSTVNSRNDHFHYSSVGVNIGLGKISESKRRNQTQTTTSQTTNSVTRVNRPGVRIISPSTSTVTVENCLASVTAIVENISSKQDITVTQNGLVIDFVLNESTVSISNVSFTGTTDFVFKVTNRSGSVERSVSFVCQPRVEMITICHQMSGGTSRTMEIPLTDWQTHAVHGDTKGACAAIPPPTVIITSPAASTITLENCVASIAATVENISRKQDITVTLNGSSVPFSFTRNMITISNLVFTGTADFIIKVTNASGTAQQSVSFICKPRVELITICHQISGGTSQSINIPLTDWQTHAAHGDTRGICPVIPPPAVTITSPATTPVTVENCIASVTATVENISRKQDITVTQNGSPVAFTFSGNRVTISNTSFTGTADFTIKVGNQSGTAEQSVSFICKPHVELITICHQVAGGSSQSINIPVTDWAVHSAHGDTRGACPVTPPPTVTITLPASSPVSSEDCIASVTATVENISRKQDIIVTQNGLPIPFMFSQNTVSISNVGFKGTTDFIIKATNASGTAQQIASFICRPPVEMIAICHLVVGGAPETISIPVNDWQTHAAHGDTRGTCPVIPAPVVIITSPAVSPVASEDCIASVTATVENISRKQDILVTQNGSPIPFMFSQNTVTISTVGFKGTTDFTIKATNASGTAQQTASFICKPPVEMITICHQVAGGAPQSINVALPDWSSHAAHGDTRGTCPVIPAPVITITSPSTSPVTSETCVANVTATVENISRKQDITVTQNGSPVGFIFSGNTITISNESFTGTADFIIRVANTSGTAEQSVSFICKPREREIAICHYPPGNRDNPQAITIVESAWPAHEAHGDTQGTCPVIPAPTVTITSPSTSPVTLENCMATVTATVENITSKQQITVTQNGSPVAFSFSGNTVTISNESFTGTADFVIRAVNASGTAEQTVSFICKPKEREITICHYPPGNRDNPQAITIGESAWPAHEAHGDTQGTCPVIPAPTVSVTSPSSSPITLENCVAHITATVENVSNKQQITVTQNGRPVAFNFSGHTITISNESFEGNAEFIIRAGNTSGTAEQSVSFICKPKEREITICHYPPGNRDNPQAITIGESAWPAHEIHGDTQGTCPVIPAPTVIITSPSTSPVTLENCSAHVTATVENISSKQQITVTQNGSPVAFNFSGNTVTISNESFTGTADFIIRAGNASGTAEQSISFICKPREREITICHYPPGNRDNPQAITIGESAWPAHEAHGDTQGPCPVIPAPTVIITSPSTSPITLENCVAHVVATLENISGKHQITVTQNGSPVAFNFSGNTVTISNENFEGTADYIIRAANASGTAEQSVSFICKPKEREITICHYPPGNKDNPQVITISESAWPAHEAHGDIQGACPVIPEPVVTITSPSSSPITLENCVANISATVENVSDKQQISVNQNGRPVDFDFSGTTITISNVSFEGTANFVIKATNASGKAEQSAKFICEPKKIGICHYPPGNKNNPQDITIAESAWPAHEAHGDTQGACPVIPEPELTIYSPETSPVTAADCKVSVQASVKHIRGKEDISVTINGNSVRFNYSDETIQVSDISFTDAATVVIVASNKSGSATRSVEFKCPPKEEEKEPKNEDDKKPETDEEKITICHIPPGNKENPQTITIPLSAWPAHEKHGDTKGPCKE
jgi:copper chaperone CopZ